MGLEIAATRLLREESAAIARMLADSTDDVAIENGSGALATTQIERFAPGFSDRTAATTVCAPADFERDNPNNVGGDIKGGSMDLKTFFARPRLSANPYWLRGKGHYLCPSSTPPGGGVQGMCGHLAARSALQHETYPSQI